MAGKRKQQQLSSERVDDSDAASDNSGDEGKPQKKSKSSKTAAPQPASSTTNNPTSDIQRGTDDNGDPFWPLGKDRRVTLSSFKGRKMVNIREYYDAGGTLKPGKKGIALSIEQYEALKRSLPLVDAELAKGGK
ncbi:ssDNA-binding transcriptional regulator [Gonapodya prolifera JEL478]|uniref:SsDNA-binding transcriptional regulator n=1 Tax=Gonapodya prolifera (strain JEL478) TaxID=1344416 RepID=A0A139AQB7_GONPJ|nr:ssDNA-binding transcriptional regulator [Gonapodya prolifera JEL478]|eukprot:KXS18940.1 ssDNA-binding transcriptional regulator [Gonapodya prolifera JEL478]